MLDLTCCSGVFQAEALWRFVHLRSQGQPPTREVIRSTLYGRVYGVDISEAAICVAAFRRPRAPALVACPRELLAPARIEAAFRQAALPP